MTDVGVVVSNLLYLIVAIVVAIIGALVVVLRHRKPKSIEANVASFHKGLRALAPEQSTGSSATGPNWGGLRRQAAQDTSSALNVTSTAGEDESSSSGGETDGTGADDPAVAHAGTGAEGQTSADAAADVDGSGDVEGTADVDAPEGPAPPAEVDGPAETDRSVDDPEVSDPIEQAHDTGPAVGGTSVDDVDHTGTGADSETGDLPAGIEPSADPEPTPTDTSGAVPAKADDVAVAGKGPGKSGPLHMAPRKRRPASSNAPARRGDDETEVPTEEAETG